MKKIIIIITFLFFTLISLNAQNTDKEFQDRYNLLVSKLGYDGVGIETLLDKWEQKSPDNVNMLAAKFSYYFTKSIEYKTEDKSESTYLGAKPILSLKDSLGRKHNFFSVEYFKADLFKRAMEYIAKAVQLYPNNLSLREAEIRAYMRYEKENVLISKTKIIQLIDYSYDKSIKNWDFLEGNSVWTFDELIQSFCYDYYKIASPSAYEAFKEVSEKMLQFNKKNSAFIDNIASYYFVYKKDFSKAKSLYNRALRYKKDDLVAIKNLILLSRKISSERLEKKNLKKLIEYSKDSLEINSALARYNFLKNK